MAYTCEKNCSGSCSGECSTSCVGAVSSNLIPIDDPTKSLIETEVWENYVYSVQKGNLLNSGKKGVSSLNTAVTQLANRTQWLKKWKADLNGKGDVIVKSGFVTALGDQIYISREKDAAYAVINGVECEIVTSCDLANHKFPIDADTLGGQPPIWYRCNGCSWTCMTTCSGGCTISCTSGCTNESGSGTEIIPVASVTVSPPTMDLTKPLNEAGVSVIGVVLDRTTLSVTIPPKPEGSNDLPAPLPTPVQLHETINPSNAANKNVFWSTSNAQIATVNATGLVSFTNKAGTATITVTTEDGGKTATCAVTTVDTVVQPSSVYLDKTSVTIYVGDQITLIQTILPSNSTIKTVTWSTSNASIATVVSGIVTGIAVGTATVTVTTSNGKYATCIVTVQTRIIEPSGISLNKTSLSQQAGTTFTLIATVTPENAVNKNVTWTSTNNSVVQVAGGTTLFVSPGTAIVMATTYDGQHSATCTVTVTEIQPTSVSISPTVINNLVSKAGGFTSGGVNYPNEVQVSANVLPSNAANRNVTWSSNKPTYVSVTSSGGTTAIVKGLVNANQSVTITATSAVGARIATITANLVIWFGTSNG